MVQIPANISLDPTVIPLLRTVSVTHLTEVTARFSFKGVDGIIDQIRDIIKDFWYRKKLERKKMELEILNKLLGIMKEAGIHEDEKRDNIKKLINPLEKLSSIVRVQGIKLIGKDEQT